MASEMSSVFRIKGISLFSADLEFEEILQIEEKKSDFSYVQHFSSLFYSYKFLKKCLAIQLVQ